MSSLPKSPPQGKVLICLPAAMLSEIDHLALQEHRTRSDLIREALRRYLLTSKYAVVPQMTLLDTPAS